MACFPLKSAVVQDDECAMPGIACVRHRFGRSGIGGVRLEACGLTRQFGPTNVCWRGFSLLELVMVVGIISVMAAIAVPRFALAHHRYRADLTARRIRADLEYARTVARRNSSLQAVWFEAATDSYTLPGLASMDRPTGDYTVVLSDSPYRTDLASASFENADGYVSSERIVFDMWGQPLVGHPAAGIALSPLVSGSVVIKSGGQTRTITVTPVTGEASIQ